MSVIAPNTDLDLLKCPLEADNLHQLTFTNSTAQTNYFGSLPKLSATGFTYQRKDGVIRFNEDIDTIRQYNYVRYRNRNHGDKWFYAFITDMQYINDNMTAITIKTDVWQTWQFDIVYKRCFVEREHANDDTIGHNILPEPIDVGDCVINGATVDQILVPPSGSNNYRIIAAVSDLAPIESYIPSGFSNVPIYNNVPSGLTYVALNGAAKIANLVSIYDQASKPNAIYSIFIVPYSAIQDNEISWDSGNNFGFLSAILGVHNIGSYSMARKSTLNGYSPRNNKLLCYPWNYCYLTNNAGGSAEFRYEDFTSGTASFTTSCAIGNGCSIKTVPQNYMGQSTAYNFGMVGAKIPACGWNSDAYTNWLTQNAVNYTWDYSGVTQGLTGALGLAGLAIGGGVGLAAASGAAMSLINSTMSAVKSEWQSKLLPDQAKGDVSAGDINYVNSKCAFSIIPMSVRYEVAKMADAFFDLYGYKQNELKVPNVTGRRYWNYVKTVGSNLEGNIPQDDIAEIKAMFDRGITFWHDPSKFLDYSQTNSIVS